MGLKYKSDDVNKLVNSFYNISKDTSDRDTLQKELSEITKYPVNVVNEFLKCIRLFTSEQIKDNYIGVLGYITIRLNIVHEFNEKPEIVCDND